MKRTSLERPEKTVGICCWRCGNRRLDVVYTRRRRDGTVARRRECRQCKTRITTRERNVGLP